jgi:hypothetical protein
MRGDDNVESMANDEGTLDVLIETARNLENQSQILKRQSEDLRKEAARIRSAVKAARKVRADKRKR